MSFIIFGLWYFRVLTISLENQILRFGVPILILALILCFCIINHRTLPILLKNTSFRCYLFLLLILFISTGIAYINHFPLVSSVSAFLKFLLMGGFFILGFILTLYGKKEVALWAVTTTVVIHLSVGFFGYFLVVV